jgi:hypothetical protein
MTGSGQTLPSSLGAARPLPPTARHWSGRAVRWFDFAQRAALHAVAPPLQASEQQNLELQNRLAREAQARLDAAVERAVPNYREIDQDPRWHNWLRSVDPTCSTNAPGRGYRQRHPPPGDLVLPAISAERPHRSGHFARVRQNLYARSDNAFARAPSPGWVCRWRTGMGAAGS